MLITYIRSSSYNTHKWCPHKYFNEYVLGWNYPAGKAAEKGTIVHKGLEILAMAKKAQQEGKKKIVDELCGDFFVDNIFVSPIIAFNRAYLDYTKLSKFKWSIMDRNEMQGWFLYVLKFKNGRFNPLKREVIEPEQRFDIVIDKPWASYDYGNGVSGQLCIKGSIDLVLAEDNPDEIELVDWKTGKRKDWVTGEEKTYSYLTKDLQLGLYAWAVHQLYPEKHIAATIFFIKDGGPFTVMFGEEDFERTEELLRNEFLKIKETKRPELKITFKCSSFCPFYKNPFPGHEHTGKNHCEFIRDEILTKGIDYVTEHHKCKGHDINTYNEPGAT